MRKNKNKVAILTMVSKNYGNRLQNYAVQTVLQNMGLKCETLLRFKRRRWYMEVVIREIAMRRNKTKWDFFHYFNSKIKWSKYSVFTGITPPNLNDKYDYFIIGSDQVWNLKLPAITQLEFAPFADKQKKVAFSASFGADSFDEENKAIIVRGLSDIANVSVREDSGAKLVRELTGREVSVLIDPTMMLDAKDWYKVMQKPKHMPNGEKYIFIYFLGDINEKQKGYIQQIAKQYELKIYDVLNTELSVGPAEFLYLIANASLVFTDSFHACVFSFLFQKPFQVFRREGEYANMFGRIETLLTKFSLQRKCYGTTLENELFEYDYDEGYTKLTEERKKVLSYLKESMGLE